MSRFADHFSRTAPRYSQYRPGYPADLFKYLAELCPAHDAMWDCATGSGQAAQHFTRYFNTVFASDASFEQTRNAIKTEGLYYLTSLAEQTPFRDRCLDMITVAQAIHWFELERFYAEVRRLLKPGGLLAIWTYNLMQISPAIDREIGYLYDNMLGEYWPFERQLVENGYRDLHFPFTEHETPDFAMQTEWGFEQLLGYLSTWSAVKRYKDRHKIDPVLEMTPRLETAWGKQHSYQVSWPLTIRLASVA